MSSLPGTLPRATAGRDHTEFIPIWEVKETYRVKVLSTKNVNVAENHKVSGHDQSWHSAGYLSQLVGRQDNQDIAFGLGMAVSAAGAFD